MSSLKAGLLPVNQEAVALGDIVYSDYSGSLEDIDRDQLARTLGPINKVSYECLMGQSQNAHKKPIGTVNKVCDLSLFVNLMLFHMISTKWGHGLVSMVLKTSRRGGQIANKMFGVDGIR